MINPKQFYSPSDIPTEKDKRAIWNIVSNSLFPKRTSKAFSFDRRSFVYGMAASFIVIFTSIGMYSTFKMLVETSQPQEIRMDNAYQSAIRGFEEVVSSAMVSSKPSPKNDLASLRVLRLQYLNEAIEQLKKETNSHDLSPLKRQRLHALYNMKLTLLQEMLHQGEIEL
ncbi:MAG: hypothetical protein WCX28_10665 [Bacteriovoracaceae bacterium]|nr:hypothetical protein [Bacteroidota bacterium]